MTIRISVVVPTHNAAIFLSEALESALSQMPPHGKSPHRMGAQRKARFRSSSDLGIECVGSVSQTAASRMRSVRACSLSLGALPAAGERMLACRLIMPANRPRIAIAWLSRQSSQGGVRAADPSSMSVKQDTSRMVSGGTRPVQISVIVPSYNSGAYLRRALVSALDQVPGPHEVIVQDGGSTDDTLDILRSFGERVTWVSAPDDGQSDALNKSLARATGDVVVWLNADDILLPGSLAAAADAFESDPDLAFAYGDFDIIGSSGEVLRSYSSSPFSWMRIFARGCYIFSGSLLVRRQALLAVGGFDPTLRACMDFDLMLRLDAAGRSTHLRRTIGQLRMHGTNKSSTMLSLFFRESLRVRKRYARRSIRLWLITLWSTAIQVAALATTPLRYSTRWPRHGRRKTL